MIVVRFRSDNDHKDLLHKVKKMKGQLLVLNENITVKVPGDVKCVSDEGTKVNEDGSVTIKPVNGNNDYAVNTYIIFE